MTDDLPIYVVLIGIPALLVFLAIYKIRRRRTIPRHPQPVRIVFKDPFGLASGFDYTLNPNSRWGSYGNMEFITATGQATPPEHREFELEDGKQGDTLSVTWKLPGGPDVTDTTVLPISSNSTVTVKLTKTRAICFATDTSSAPSSSQESGEVKPFHSYGWKIRLRVWLVFYVPFFLMGPFIFYKLKQRNKESRIGVSLSFRSDEPFCPWISYCQIESRGPRRQVVW